MSEDVPLQMTCRFAGIVTLFATIRLFTGVGSKMAFETTSCCARVVALWTTQGFLSTVNQHVSFQPRRCVAWVAALFAILTFLSIMLKIVDIELSGHVEYFKFGFCIWYVVPALIFGLEWVYRRVWCFQRSKNCIQLLVSVCDMCCQFQSLGITDD